MDNTKRHTLFEVLGILAFGIGFIFAWSQCHAQADRARQCETQLAAIVDAQKPPLDEEQIKKSLWEITHPCGDHEYYYPFAEMPTPERCREAAKREKQKNKAHKEVISLWDRYGCATSSGYTALGYPTGLVADTVDAPYNHNSWVLDGECEKLAHDLKSSKENPMCLDFVDDDFESAERCRKELYVWLDSLCAEGDLDDHTRRFCLTVWGDHLGEMEATVPNPSG